MNRVDQCTSSDMEGLKKWAKIPVDIQQLRLHNVFCSKCGVTTDVYNLPDKVYDDMYALMLHSSNIIFCLSEFGIITQM